MGMCKELIARNFAKHFGVTIKKSKEMFDWITDEIQNQLANGSYFILPGICKITTREVKAHETVHPFTHKRFVMKAYRLPKFRPLGKFKDFVRAIPKED